MKTVIKIKRDTVRSNPEAGQTTTAFMGRTTSEIKRYVYKEGRLVEETVCDGVVMVEERIVYPSNLPEEKLRALQDGKISEFVVQETVHQDVQHVRHPPKSSHLYEYEDAVLDCVECHAKFKPSELQANVIDWGGDGEASSNAICPHCGEWDCCEFEYESLESAVRGQLEYGAMYDDNNWGKDSHEKENNR